MKKKYWLILLGCTLLTGGWLLYFLFPSPPSQGPKNAAVTADKKSADKMPMEFEGLTVSSYTNGKLASRVKIRSMRSSPRKVMVFQVKSFDELLLFDVQSEIFQNETESPDLLPLGDIHKQLTGGSTFKGLGRITQARMLRFSATFTRKGKETLQLEAQEGAVDFLKHSTVLQNASLFQPSLQRKITSARIDWDKTTKRFIIPGEYQESQGNKTFRGSGVSVGTDFSIAPLPKRKTT